MFRPELAMLTTPARAASPAAATAPIAPMQATGPAAGARFSQTFRQLDGEIRDYIANGSTEGTDMPALSSAARAYLARMQAAPAAGDAPLAGGLQALPALDGIGALRDVSAGSVDRDAFLGHIAPWAEQAGQQLGVAPDILAAHAALESGWGQRPLRQADGGSTHNLFGIKAGGGWRGDSAEALTTEYEDGVALKKTERFRSYPDAGAAFRDFTQLMQGSPRYQAALNTGTDARAYAEALARGGYATDPNYADKLVGVVNRLRAR